MKTLFTIAALLVVSMSFATERPLNNANKILTEAAASPSFEMNMYQRHDGYSCFGGSEGSEPAHNQHFR